MSTRMNTWKSGSLLQLLNDPERLKRAEKWGMQGPAYHSTRHDIDEFDLDRSDIGFHMGTLDQAENRMKHTATTYEHNLDSVPPDMSRVSPYGLDANIIPLVHNIKNPLLMQDVGEWNNSTVVSDALFRNPQISDWMAEQVERINSDVTGERYQYGDIDAWLESVENRDALDEMRELLKKEKFDGIEYRNDVETSSGPRSSDMLKVKPIQDKIDALMNEHVGRRPTYPDPQLRSTIGDEKWDQLTTDYSNWLAKKRKGVPEEVKAQIHELEEQKSQMLRNPEGGREGSYSLIAFDPDQVRTPNAEFAPPGKRDMSKAQLLRSGMVPTAGAGLLGAGMMMSPDDAMAANQQAAGDPVSTVLGMGEDIGREIVGAGAGLITGDKETRQNIQSGGVFGPSGGFEALTGLMGQTILPMAQRGLQSAQDAAYPAMSALMDMETPRGQPVGENIRELVDGVSGAWSGLSPENQERLVSGGILGMTAMDALPGPNPIDDRWFNRVTERRRGATGEYPLPLTSVKRREIEQLPDLSIEDLEGRPFVASIADRTDAGGVIESVNGNQLPVPVDLQGGQKFMQEKHNIRDGVLWASDPGPSQGILNAARKVKEETGQNPVFLPWRMTPTGGDFSTMSGELLLSNAMATLPKKTLKQIDQQIKSLTRKTQKGETVFEGIKDWPGFDDPDAAMAAWANATGDQRKKIKTKILDKYRGDTGLSQPDARLAVTDPEQLYADDFMMHNVGILDLDQDLGPRGHNTYGATLKGEPLGRLKENVSIFDLLPELATKENARRSAETRATTGVITPSILDMLFR